MKIKTAHIALLLSILALAVSLFTAAHVSRNDNEALIDALMAQNQQLQAQIDALASENTDIPETIPGASLTAVAWPDGSGADVTLTMDSVPEGAVSLRVMLGSEVITEVPCFTDGGTLTATAPVPANNGYTYSLITGQESKTLASPENPAYPDLVYLADSLSAYCNLIVGDWNVQEDVLTLEDGYATIHTSRFSEGEAYTDVRLVLKHGDEVLSQIAISPAETEDPGVFACAVTDAAFTLPVLEEGDQVDLWLEATLPGGQILTTCAATWIAMHSGFTMSAG